MRILSLLAPVLASLTLHAAPTEVIACRTSIKMDDVTSNLSVTVYRDGSEFSASSVNSETGRPPERTTNVVVTDATVRDGLSPDADPKGLNVAEQLVAHAMTLETMTADGGGQLSSGIDLKRVRSATVYRIDPKPREIGMAAVFDARDADGRSLGRFLGGFLIGACQ